MAHHDVVADRVPSNTVWRRFGRETFVFLALTGCVAILVGRLVAPPVILLLTSLTLVTVAVGLALGAWLRNSDRNAQGVCAWDVAALLMLLGFAAAIASDPMEMLASLEAAPAAAR